MSNELKKEVTCWYKKRLTPEQEELQKKAEIAAKVVFDAAGWDPEKEKKLYKDIVQYLKEPGADSNKLIAEITGQVLFVAIKEHLKEKPKKLPNIAVIGDFWELAPIETLLIWEGYDLYKDKNGWPENWNEPTINDDGRQMFPVMIKSLVATGNQKSLQYMNHTNFNTGPGYTMFFAHQPKKILQFIHDFNK